MVLVRPGSGSQKVTSLKNTFLDLIPQNKESVSALLTFSLLKLQVKDHVCIMKILANSSIVTERLDLLPKKKNSCMLGESSLISLERNSGFGEIMSLF